MALRRSLVLAAVSCAIAASAHANDYPTKPVRFIVATAAGGNVDLMARIVGQKLGDGLGRPFVIDNRGGGGGVIGEEAAARSNPDGHTLLFVSMAHVVHPQLNKKLTYDTMKDLVPVSLVVSVPNVLLVNRAVPAQSVPELVALAKAKPGGLNYAASHATSLHIAGELFKAMAGVNIVRIAYKGAAQGLNDLLGGRVHLMFPTSVAVTPHLKAGQLRALAVTSAQPSALAPGLPTIAASGLPGYESIAIYGVFAPAGTPRPIVGRLNEEIVRVLTAPELKDRFFNIGMEPVGGSPAQLMATMKTEIARISKVIRETGIRSD